MRLFIAIDVPEHIKQHLVELQKQLSKTSAHLNPAKSFHLTLKFLGETSPEQAERVKKQLDTITFKPFTLTLNETGVFPSEQHIRVVWAGMKPAAPILALQRQIDESLAGLFPTTEDFVPHLTLARVKSVPDKTAFKQALTNITPKPLSFTVTQFKLIESQLSPEGPHYRDLAVYNAEPKGL